MKLVTVVVNYSQKTKSSLFSMTVKTIATKDVEKPKNEKMILGGAKNGV